MRIILLIASSLLSTSWSFRCTDQAVGSGTPCYSTSNSELKKCNSGFHCDFPNSPNPFTDFKQDNGDKSCVADVATKLHNGQTCSDRTHCLSNSCSSTCQAGTTAVSSSCTYSQECASQKCVNTQCFPTVAQNQSCQDPEKFCPYSLSCIQQPYVGSGTVCFTQLSGDTCSSHAECAPGLYCDTTCKPTLDSGSCQGHQQCTSGYCASNTCTAATPAGQGCSVDEQCGLSSFCNGSSQCQYKKPIGGTCAQSKECVSGNCSTTCIAKTGTAIGGGCTVESECAGGVKCILPTKGLYCKRFLAHGSSCTADTNCGPGHFCSNSLCKRIYLDTGYANPPTQSFECSTGHFYNNACATVTVSDGGTTLAYPYKCSSTCVYTNSDQANVVCSSTNGFCPIVEGMPEYLTYQTALSNFYNLNDVQNFANLTPENFRQLNPFNLIADFNGASDTIASALQNVQKLYFQITHTSLFQAHCTNLLASNCASQIPYFSSIGSISCRQDLATTFTCGSAPNTAPSGTCASTAYGLNSPFEVSIINSDLTSYSCALLSNSNTLTPSTTTQNIIQALVPPADSTCGNAKPCAGQKCSTVQNDSDQSEVCSEGRCKNAAGMLCTAGTGSVYSSCTNQANCGSGLFCDLPDNTCKAINSALSHECSTDENCAAAQYCDSTTLVCTTRKTAGAACSKTEECPTNQYCKALLCTDRQADDYIGCDTHTDCSSGYCHPRTCIAKLNLQATCTSNEGCISGLCTTVCRPAQNPTSCSHDEECITTHYCAAQACVSRIDNGNGCDESLQNCVKGSICSGGTCSTLSNGANCQSNFNCPVGQYCSSNQCVTGKSVGTDCTFTSECGTDMACENRVCRIKSGQNEGCTQASDCLSNLCSPFLKCIAPPTIGKLCPGNICATGAYCSSSDRICYAEKALFGSCTAQNECAPNNFCHKTIKYCENQIASGSGCSLPGTDYHKAIDMCSTAGQRCISNTCQIPTATSCTHSYQCAQDKYCSGGSCVAKKTANQSCSSDEECVNTLYCNTGATPNVCKQRTADNEVCSQDIECAVNSSCSAQTYDQCVLSRNQGDVCFRQQECAYHMHCLPQPTYCHNDGVLDQSCVTDVTCGAGMLCGDSQKCAQIASIAAEQTATKDELCASGMRDSSSNTCFEYTVKDASNSNTLEYPYECTVGGLCSYESQNATTVTQACQVLSPNTVKGYCPIIKGVKEYSLYRQSVVPLILASTNCMKSLQATPEMSGALAHCTNATAEQKSTAWGAYFTVRYPNFLHNYAFTSCKDSIVSSDAQIAAFGAVPDFTVQNYLKLPTNTAIDANTPEFYIQAVFASFSDNFGNNLTESQIFYQRLTDLSTHQSSKFAQVRDTIGSKLDASFPTISNSSEFQSLMNSNDIFIKLFSNGAVFHNISHTNMVIGKETFSQASPQFKGTLNDMEVKVSISPEAKTSLAQKGVDSINYQIIKSTPSASFSNNELTLILVAYNAQESTVDVQNLSTAVQLQFTNTNAADTSTRQVRVGIYDYNSNSWSPLNTDSSNGVYTSSTTHFSTFGLFLYEPPTPVDRSDLYVVALVCVMVAIGVGVLVLIHFLCEKKMNSTSDRYLFELDKQIRHSRNQNVEDFLKNDSKIINVEEIDNPIQRQGSSDELQLPQVQTSEPRTLLPYITKVFRHLHLLSKYTFCKFWFYNFLYLSPFLSSCFRYHPNINRKCEVIIDIGRLMAVYCFGIIIGSQVQAESDVYLYCILVGLFLMCPLITGLFQSLVTVKMRRESLSIHKITQYLLVKLPSNKDLGITRPRNIEELEELKIQGYDWAPRRFSMILFALVTTVLACGFLGVFGVAMYFAKDLLYTKFTEFWNGIEGATLGVIIGFAFCQLVVLWCTFMKGVIFRARKRAGCGRVLETILVDVRTSLIFNDYRSLHLKFQRKEENP